MSDRLIVVDGYNVILRTPQLAPGPERDLRASRDKLVNLLSWMMGANDARFVVVFDGADARGARESTGGRVEVQFSKPPEKADDLIRHIVEREVDRFDRVTVVTSDLEVARHARAMGADLAIADLFLASALGGGAAVTENEKPATLSRAELEEWAKLFQSRPKAPPDEDEPQN